jgi:3-deoxy-manno-octulosonate cytidylyltransferase (CMP-KDO synthetase)
MSRQPIPGLYAGRTIGKATHWKQVCVIPFRRSTLEKFVNLPQTTLEKYESIDMMRLIENGIPVGLVPWTRSESQAVDIPSDVQKVELLLQADPIYKGIFK